MIPAVNASRTCTVHNDDCDPSATSSYKTTTDNNVSQKLNDTTHESHMDTFDSGLEYMDKLEYDSSSDSDVMDEVDYTSCDFGNSSFCSNNEKSNQNDSVLTKSSNIEFSCQASQTLNVSATSSQFVVTKDIEIANDSEKLQQFSTSANFNEIPKRTSAAFRSTQRDQTFVKAQAEYKPNNTTRKHRIKQKCRDTDKKIEFANIKDNALSQGEFNDEIPPTQYGSNDLYGSTPMGDPDLQSQRHRSTRRKRPQFIIGTLISRRTRRKLTANTLSSLKRKNTERNTTDKDSMYRKIRKNVYLVKPMKSAYSDQCTCKPEDQCGDNCLNRMVFVECDPKSRCSETCKNKVIQNNIVASVERFKTNNKGWGVRACQSIKSGTYIIEYIGEVVNEQTFEHRLGTIYENDFHHYCLKLERDRLIDSHRMGNLSRFFNHSCKPNAEMQKWYVNGLPRMALFATKDIKIGDEIRIYFVN